MAHTSKFQVWTVPHSEGSHHRAIEQATACMVNHEQRLGQCSTREPPLPVTPTASLTVCSTSEDHSMQYIVHSHLMLFDAVAYWNGFSTTMRN